MTLNEYFNICRECVDSELDQLLPTAKVPPGTIHAAMRHSLFAGGKRIRPILAIAAAEACGNSEGMVTAASALECVHTYSLIHDDLPALDNDDLRRGKPTCHKIFGEAIAILAGNALLTLAFKVLAELKIEPEKRVALSDELAVASGTPDGMIAGQVADLEAEGQVADPESLQFIHRAKTAALIRASVRFGALYVGADSKQYEALSEYGSQIGLAFQIVDDILDVVSSSENLGKTAGKDMDQEKATYPALYGLDESSRRARQCHQKALLALHCFGESAWALRGIADRIVERTN